MSKMCILLFCILFLGYNSASGQQLTLYVLPPPKPFNWKSPHHLFISLLGNFTQKKESPYSNRALGHIAVELVSNGDTILTGMVGNRKTNFLKSVLLEKKGLGVLFDVFPGHLETKETLHNEIQFRLETGRCSFIRYKIPTSSYQHLRVYLDSFLSHGYDKLYNGLNRPLEGKGSGCSAFAFSFLELINAIDSGMIQKCATQVTIPDHLIGGHWTHNRVSIWSVLFSFRWSPESKKHTHFMLIEPGFVHDWIHKNYSESYSNENKFKPVKIKNSKGLEVDCIQECIPKEFNYFRDYRH